MNYRLLTAEQIMKEYPFKNLPSSFQGVFAPDNGCINVPQVLRSLHALASGYGAKLVPQSRVQGLTVQDDSVTVEADIGGATSITAHRCILAAGAYTNHILASVGVRVLLNIWEMVYEYYATAAGPGGTVFPSMWFQFQDPTDEPPRSNLFYGFPTVPWGPPNLSRIAVDDAVNVITDPHLRKMAPSEHDLAITSDFVRDHCMGVDARPNFSGTCLQANVVDNMFVLDTLPASVGAGHRNVVLFTAGWGFKFVPLIGRILRELVLEGETAYDISRFAITRPGVLSPLPPEARKADVRAFCRAPY
jgi:sarcosine oxidase/L-pipecolate oxidase